MIDESTPTLPVVEPAVPTEMLLDHLTKIANRRAFESALDEHLSSDACAGRSTTILLLDLDGFKVVNDTLGHAVGDSLLRMVALRMQSLMATSDMVARLGGDEFGIILGPGSDSAAVAGRMVEVVRRTYLIDGCPVDIGVSIGVALAPQDGEGRPVLMRSADLALYQAKASGRNCFLYFQPEMAAQAQAKRKTEVELRKALVLRQLELHYRPQVDVKTQRLLGFDAVLHWRHPSRGLLNAPDFMQLAEDIGVISPISEWVLKAVCREAVKWPKDITISVAVSPRQFETQRFFDVVKNALDAARIPGGMLEIEVTEGILLRDGRSVHAMLDKLRTIGVRVAINSFGTGIASLGQIVEFPLDKIKIDRALVEETGTGVKERAIVRAIAALGESLGIATLAEGVNTTEHLSRIQRDGCTTIQGYLVSEAVPAGELAALVGRLLSASPNSEEIEGQTHG